MTLTIISLLALFVQGANMYLLYWLTKRHTFTFENHTTHRINTNADYLTARALILQHLLDDWDKERWQAELEKLDAMMTNNKPQTENPCQTEQ